MPEPLSDEHLEIVLASVGEHLVVPDAEPSGSGAAARFRSSAGSNSAARRRRSFEPRSRSTPRSRRWLRPSWIAAAAALVVVASSVAVGPAREAVADWFGFGRTHFERVPPEAADPYGLPTIDAGMPAVSARVAEAQLGRPLPTVEAAGLGDPDQIAVPPEGGVLLAWDHGQTTLWIQVTGDPAAPRIRKLLDDFDTVEPVDDLGEGAVLVEGDHVLRTPNRRLAADSVVLWIDDGLELRLESNLGGDVLLSAARSVQTRL